MSRSGQIARLRPSARKVALLTMREVERGETLQPALSRALDAVELSAEARRQAADLACWCLRGQTRCEFALSRVFPKFRFFAPEVRHLLVAAAASLFFQEGAPAYAVVNETVEDIRHLAGKGVGGAANGGLRSLLRLGEEPASRDFYRLPGDKDELSSLFRLLSVPEALGRLLVKECGLDKTRLVLGKSLRRPVVCVRLNPRHGGFGELRQELTEKGGQLLPGRAGETGLFFPNGVPSGVNLNELAAEGRLSLQSAGSQLALAELDLDPEAPVWDMCAGFGGKTMALLERGLCVACASDVSWKRLSRLPGECGRLGLEKPAVFLGDGRYPPLARWDGTLMLDVPCSGLGVLARRPDIKLRGRNLEEYVKTQKALLRRALLLVPKGRDIVYMTCTVTRSENTNMVREACHSFDCELAQEWSTPDDLPFDSLYAARIRG